MSIKYLDLDAVSEKFEFTVKLNGVEHVVRQSTIEDFVENAKLLEVLGPGASIPDELEVTLKILARAVPTAKEEDLRKLTFAQLDAIRDFVMTANGEKVSKDDLGEDAEGNEAKVG
jgi:hypothetical protein